VDDRGVSVAVSHAVTLGIATILITGLLLGGNQLLEDQKQRVAESGLENVGAAVMSEIDRFDAYNTSAVDGNLSVRTNQPERLAGATYDVRLFADADGAQLRLRASEVDRVVRIRFENQTSVCESTVTGGDMRVGYDATRDCLYIEGGA
jgi:hypothetical protein